MNPFEIVIVGDGYYEGRRVRFTRGGFEPTGDGLRELKNLAELDGGPRVPAGTVVLARECADSSLWFHRWNATEIAC